MARKSGGKPKLTIMMPVRNEGVNIEIMLKILNAVIEVPHEILIVHDDMGDDSIPVVKRLKPEFPHVRLVHNTLGRGVANAILAGVKAAEGEYILIFCVDDVGPVLAIEDMMVLMDGGCDLVSATRYAHGGRRLGGSIVGQVLSRVGNRMFMLLSGSVLSDSTTGIKMMRRDIFDRLNLEAKPVGWAVVFELSIKAQEAGMKLGEVPIISIDRLYGGSSTFNVLPWFREYFRWFVWGMRHLHNNKEMTKDVEVRRPSTCIC
ncbi:MAG: glycosyltransferase [Candidatus Altiarchaeales archaeon]|nr:glycosyltransferase [Candidatus Altiarchaeales archaeon]MBD3415639.1 glycosyltransferase [Candidatus Altiarchaeales archaeon]